MNKLTHFTLWLLLFASCFFTQIHAGSSGRRNSSPNRSNGMYGNYVYNQQPVQPQQQAQTPKEYLDSKPGISTFGIISIIFFVILGCLLFYYGIMCYPILCRYEKKYPLGDVISMNSGNMSRSMQSMEKSSVASTNSSW